MSDAPRIEPVTVEELSEKSKHVLGQVSGSPQGVDNIYLYLLKHKSLFDLWGAYAGAMIDGQIPGRQKEIAVLRLLKLTNDDYDIVHHTRVAKRYGITDEEIQRAMSPGYEGWSEFEAALLKATDELFENACVSDETWAILAKEYTVEQMIEFVSIIGTYHGLAYLMNSLKVPVEEGL